MADLRGELVLISSALPRRTLPDTIGNLGALQRGNLDNNNMWTTLPDTGGDREALQHTKGNAAPRAGLPRLPRTNGNLTLRWLHLSNNRFTTLQESFCNIGALQQFDHSSNELPALPAAVGNLLALRSVCLNNNLLTTLPDTVGNLVALRKLSLRTNRLAALPATIGDLVALQHLNLLNNQLTTVPGAIGNLVALQHLPSSTTGCARCTAPWAISGRCGRS